MSSRQSIAADDDVRKSIDVLDKVLSEFDDIDGFCSSDHSSQGQNPSDGEQQMEVSTPPPIDRSLKPRHSPPTLPKKTKKKDSLPQVLPPPSPEVDSTPPKTRVTSPLVSPSTTNTQKSKRSEASSHEYQEINCRPDSQARDGRPSRAAQQRPQFNPQLRSHSRTHLLRGNSALEPRHTGKVESPMRKSRSGDVSLHSEEAQRRNGRRGNARRARSSDRVLDPRVDHFFDPRIQEMHQMGPRMVDPRMIDPRFQDPRLVGPYFVDPLLMDPKMMDPRFLDPSFNDPRLVDPRLVDPAFLVDDPRIARFPMEDPMQFPHLMTLPAGVPGPYSLPPMDPNEYPHTIPRYNEFQSMQDPLMHPEMLPPLDPHLQGFHPHFKDPIMGDPNMMLPPPPNFPLNYPLDMPIPFPMDMPPMPLGYLPRERLSYDGGREAPRETRGPRQGDVRGRARKTSQEWRPPPPEEAKRTIQRVVRNSSKEDEDRDLREEINGNQRTNRRSQSQSRRLTSTGHSDSSGRSSPLDEANGNSRSRGRHGGFRVGDPVRKDLAKEKDSNAKEIVSMPHFTTGGKDSGFEEISTDDRNGRPPMGGFVVAGVFSDSSKMYIPAPPSPTPDYDHATADSDGEESDLLQDSFYTKKEKKSSSSSTRDSLSDDSLQEGGKKKGSNSLQALMQEFHQGLPPPRHFEGNYSDDSLEEESMGPSAPIPGELRSSRRPQSLESLVSMDGSTTSFDYVPELHNKFPSTSRLSNKTSKDAFRNSLNENRNQLNKNNKAFNGKKQPARKSESLPVKPISNDKENENSRSNANKSSFSSNEENEGSSGSRKNSSNGPKKFNTIRTLMKEGLIEGLNENPPAFKPPPPTLTKLGRSSSNLEDRADSGLGSTASTNHRLDESDDLSDKSSPSSERPRTTSPPPLPPPRDSSMAPSNGPSQPLTRNQSWLYKNKRKAPQAPSGPPPSTPSSKIMSPGLPLSSIPSSKTSSNPRPVHIVAKTPPSEAPKKSKKKKEKITHVDDIGPVSNGNLASQYAMPHDHKLDNSQFSEQRKNQGNFRSFNDNLSLIYEDQASLSSQGSRSSRFFSRITESMKSNRSSNASIKNKKNNQQQKFFHGDVIRDPCLNRNKELLSPPQFQTVIDASDGVPLSRDGSGRFRSIEDLATVVESRRGLDPNGGDDSGRKRKKHSTLPSNLTPADMERQAKEVARKTVSNNRDDNDGSKFKFNIFKGFWRRNKYSFDKY